MLNKKLAKALIALILGFNSLGCGNNGTPNSSAKMALNQNEPEKKKINSDKWAEFQQGFKKKTTVAGSIHDARVKIQMDSIEKEYNITKVPITSRIDPKKWEEFQIAFTTRAKYYINNISNAFN